MQSVLSPESNWDSEWSFAMNYSKKHLSRHERTWLAWRIKKSVRRKTAKRSSVTVECKLHWTRYARKASFFATAGSLRLRVTALLSPRKRISEREEERGEVEWAKERRRVKRNPVRQERGARVKRRWGKKKEKWWQGEPVTWVKKREK